ncbi:MAG: AAA-like domain-containing protein [Polyangiaceae bacterium]
MPQLSRAEFIRQLADQIFDVRRIQLVADDCGLPPGEIDWQGPSRLVWSDVLAVAERCNALGRLRDRISQDLHNFSSLNIEPPIPAEGGGLSWSADWDVGRQEEEQAALGSIRGGDTMPFVLQAPTGYGRTWFLQRLEARLQDQVAANGDPIKVYVLRDTAFKTDAGGKEFFRTLANAMAEQTPTDLDAHAAWWERRERNLSPPECFGYFIKDLCGAGGRICLLIDIPETIWQLDNGPRGDFFGRIREWKHAGPASPLKNLRSVVAFSVTPALLTNLDQSANLSDEVWEIGGFVDGEIRELAFLHGLSWSAAEIRTVQRLVDGHPRYARRLLRACRAGKSFADLVATSHHPKGIFHYELLQIRTLLRQRGSLWAAFQSVAKDRLPPKKEADYIALLQAGIIQSADGGKTFQLRFELLERILELPG